MKTKTLLIVFFAFCVKLSNAQTLQCNNWLSTPSYPSAVNIGDLDVPGTQLTVEALIYQTSLNTSLNVGDIVSKHRDPNNDNYLLRTDGGSITTANGFFQTQPPSSCPAINNNQVYHVAMVYDGATLKYYRNGFLISQVNANGNLVQNNFNTRIGFYDYQLYNTQFFGYINEVRIWNVARTQSDLRANMFNLPNPTTQSGLLGYYTFNSLANRQGTTAWNGILNGNSTINATITNCTYSPDSCGVMVYPPASCSDTCYWKVTGNNILNNNNIFGTLTNHDIKIETNSIYRGVLTANGKFGWNTQSPTATFHNNGTVRLENLPNGVGNALVVDANGNVMVAQSIIYKQDNPKVEDEIEILKMEIEKLKLQISEVKEKNNISNYSVIKKSEFKLYQNIPNPSTGRTTIRYSVPDGTKNLNITITSTNGVILKTYNISNAKSDSIVLEKNTLPFGTYIYSLISNGVVKDSKTMILSY